MFSYPVIIRMQHTDATGAIYFPNYFLLATECLEAFLAQKGWPAVQNGLHIPVVHAECDCKIPVRWGTPVVIELTPVKTGNTSVTLRSVFKLSPEVVAATVQVTHVTVDKADGRPIPLPQVLRDALQEII